MNKLTQAEAAYIAALIDGEGSISICKTKFCNKYRAVVSISNTNKEIVDWLKNVAGAGAVHYRKPRKVQHRGVWEWALSVVPARKLLCQCLPHMKLKNRQAELLLNLGKEDVDGIVKELNSLNLRGSKNVTVCQTLPKKGSVKHLRLVDKAYLSGIVDGEGSFHIRQHKRWVYAALRVENTNPKLMLFLNDTGFGSLRIRGAQSNKCRPSFVWDVGHRELRELLPDLKQLRIKRPQAKLLQSFYQSKAPSAVQDLKALNQRGISCIPAST